MFSTFQHVKHVKHALGTSQRGFFQHVKHIFDLLEIEVVRSSEGANLDRRDKERHNEHLNRISYPQFHAYLMHIVPVRNR